MKSRANSVGRRIRLLCYPLSLAVVITGMPVPVAYAQEKPRNLLEMLFGVQRQTVKEPRPTVKKQRTTRKKAPRRQGTSSTARNRAPAAAPVAPAVAKADDARKILVVGDFMASSLARGLTDSFASNAHAVVIGKANGSSGLVRDDFYDWNDALPKLIESEKPDLITIMLGGNDRQAIRHGGASQPLRSDLWTQEYEKRVKSLVALARENNLPLVWVGQPSYQSDRMSVDMTFLNGVYQKHATAAGGEFVDIWGGFADASGAYITSGPDVAGQQTRLRNSDGITLTPAGIAKLAFFVEKPIQRILGLPTDGGAMAVAPEEALPQIVAPLVNPGNATKLAPVAFSDPGFDGGEQLLRAPAEPAKPNVDPSPREKLVYSGLPAPSQEGRADNFSWPQTTP
ncbi:DUF459 domain-containing protein [Aureimonas fodinaquatilis]|uniref:DUF459 domain-containing protein n=1 Tax=Aureimonas fodinaquatilis TaxID=2565783 RepID=A0A5B0E1J4_9HYPH|nr:SGNH family hydrolase [Aureimonas fodinaquatilis]KAA0972528.1 DUF459 domain-containing protein [Aureimonas fodinaquatilis]